MKKIVIALMVVAISLSCIFSVSALGTVLGGAETGQITAFFADFDPSAITEMIDGMDFSGILNDLGFGDIGDLVGGANGNGGFGDFDLGSLLGGIDLGSLIDIPQPTSSVNVDPVTQAPPTEAPTIAPSTAPIDIPTQDPTEGPTADDYVCPKCGHHCHCDTNCTCAPGCVCNPTQAPATNPVIPKTGDSNTALVGTIAGIMLLAGVAYVCTAKKKAD